jgi:anti-sigma factor RsiW
MAGIDDQRGGGEPRLNGAERELWRRSAGSVIAEDEAERFLDLAGFAEGRLDPDEHERVAERLARDPDSAADVAAARSFAERGLAAEVAPTQIIARACALVVEDKSASTGWVIPFPRRYRPQPTLPGVARWAGLAAAMLVASWLGFDLGSSTSAAFGPIVQPSEDSLVRDMLEPSTGFVRDLTEGLRT